MLRIVAEWLEEFTAPDMIRRDVSPVDLLSLNEIFAIVGPRRAGKTYYMFQLIDALMASGSWKKEDILFVDFEDYRLAGFQAGDIECLFAAHNQLTGKSPTFLFFDEIQHISGWSRLLRTLHNRRTFRIIVSGRNSELLSGEIATELRGRYKSQLILPFSFSELLQLRGVNYSKAMMHTPGRGRLLAVFDEYMQWGGYPEVVKKKTPIERKQLLQSYYQTVFYKDLLERHNIKAQYVLNAMMHYCLNLYADLFSISAFERSLKATGESGSKRTIANYLHYLRDAFVLISAEKYSASPRKRMMNPWKIYLADIGFRNLGTDFSPNRGKILENLVALELFRRQKEFFYYKQRGECDFVIRDGVQPVCAIQVCMQLHDRNRKRELDGLADAMRALEIKKGIILTYDEDGDFSFMEFDFRLMPVWKWLLNDSFP